MVAEEGTKGLYKGMGAPLATVAVANAVLFRARGQMEAVLHQHPGHQLNVTQQMVAGAGAGVAVLFVVCPTELVKCKLQAQSGLMAAGTTSPLQQLYRGPVDVVKQVLHNKGGVLGLFKGLTSTLLRELRGTSEGQMMVEFWKFEVEPLDSMSQEGAQRLARGLDPKEPSAPAAEITTV